MKLLLWVGSSFAYGSLSPLLVDSSAVFHALRVGATAAMLEHSHSGVAVIIRVVP